ncbi:HlyD family secretion protein [Dyella kyungheensis]|jgi:membrane fusion protein (multidrug efflux system)|uniref:HlyD family secretion protein n=1 Tax=Dyella kyungheensis TaxID=1242174 RepID=A0ABS2JY02_9GAMM|nr:HlyD family secretion protein [Dyella kyungheensis]MBM7122963.1 HlyD family secretion protein [Dyella kyungheensis]
MNAVTVAERADSPAVAESTPRSKKKSLVRLAIGAAVIAGVVYGGHWWSVGRFIEDTDDAYVGGDVTVIGPKVPGYITQVAVTDNQVVHAGDLLVKIDDRDYRAALAKADGAVAAQQALLANLDATENLQLAVIRQAQASVAAAAAETQRSRDDEARYRDLSSRSAVSIESAQRADATYKTARAGSDKAQAALIAAQRQIDVIESQKLQARAALQQAKAEQEIARLNEGYTELRAPVDGVVGNRRARTGAYAAAGTQLLSVVPAHGLWVDANFKEDQLARMSAGQAVEIRADVMPGRVFHGRLSSLAPATGAQFSVLPPENATGNFTKVVQRVPVRVVLDSKDDALGVLRPGLSVVAEVDTRGRVASP